MIKWSYSYSSIIFGFSTHLCTGSHLDAPALLFFFSLMLSKDMKSGNLSASACASSQMNNAFALTRETLHHYAEKNSHFLISFS